MILDYQYLKVYIIVLYAVQVTSSLFAKICFQLNASIFNSFCPRKSCSLGRRKESIDIFLSSLRVAH